MIWGKKQRLLEAKLRKLEEDMEAMGHSILMLRMLEPANQALQKLQRTFYARWLRKSEHRMEQDGA